MSTAHMQTSGSSRLRSIGEVLAELRPEFPDLTSSKLRFLEAEGLVAPARLPNGYRKYTEPHIQRLRLVLALQRDQYLPLRVIKEKLAGQELTEEPTHTVDVRDETRPEAADGPEQDLRLRLAALAGLTFQETGGSESYGREELLAESGLERAALAELEDARLIAPLPSGRYDEDMVVVASIAARLIERGLEVRHIKPTRHTVERELGTIDSMVSTQRKRRMSGEAGEQQVLVDASREVAGGFLALHAALLRSALRSSL